MIFCRSHEPTVERHVAVAFRIVVLVLWASLSHTV